MTDYRLKLTVRNANLLRAIEESGKVCGPALADEVGISYNALLSFVNLTTSPMNRLGMPKDSALKLSAYLALPLEELWSDDQLIPLKQNHSSLDVSSEELMRLNNELAENNARDPLEKLENEEVKRTVAMVLNSLSDQQANVLRMRFGLDEYEESTLEETARILGLSKERIRQIEAKALRHLRHPSRSDLLLGRTKHDTERPISRWADHCYWAGVPKIYQQKQRGLRSIDEILVAK